MLSQDGRECIDYSCMRKSETGLNMDWTVRTRTIARRRSRRKHLKAGNESPEWQVRHAQ